MIINIYIYICMYTYTHDEVAWVMWKHHAVQHTCDTSHPLQHTATHCNTLQHTTRHYNTSYTALNEINEPTDDEVALVMKYEFYKCM